MNRTNTAEALATGAWLGLAQVLLAFAVMRGSGAGCLMFFLVICMWLLGSLIGLQLTGLSGFRERTIHLLACVSIQAGAISVLSAAPFSPYATIAGMMAAVATGTYAGVFFREQSRRWQSVAPLLLWENNGFIAGYLVAACALFITIRLMYVLAMVLLAVIVCAAYDDRNRVESQTATPETSERTHKL